MLHSLVIDGIFNGVGSVLSFLPIIVTLFFFLSILEDSGYMARVAFVMDKLLRKIGLSGRSIVPMLVGFGCTVPGVMASRTLPSERDRKMTILLTPFMSCSAKLPIYAFFTAAFFPKYSALVMVLLYFGGIFMAVLMAMLMQGTLFQGEAVPFVMELPNYRMAGAKNVGQLLWDKGKKTSLAAGIHRHFCCHDCDLVFTDLWNASQCRGGLQGQHSRRCLRPSRPGFSAAWIWRLESIDRPSNRILWQRRVSSPHFPYCSARPRS